MLPSLSPTPPPPHRHAYMYVYAYIVIYLTEFAHDVFNGVSHVVYHSLCRVVVLVEEQHLSLAVVGQHVLCIILINV